METLADGIAPFELQEVCTDESLPGGFGPIPRIDAGQVLQVDPDRIVRHGRHLPDPQFRAFCQAIHAWQNGSAMDYTLQLSPDLIVLKFMQDQPSAAQVLTQVAESAGIPLAEFLGAGRGEPADLHLE
jgi:hypothetical protein